MTIATSVSNHLRDKVQHYWTVVHPHSSCSSESAKQARVSGNSVAKAVVLRDKHGYAVAVLPAENHLDLDALNRMLDRDLKMALESELARLFPDCEPGAVPALGPIYGLLTLVDASLCDLPELYFEGGDHETLIGVGDSDFRKLMMGAQYGRFSQPRH